MPQRSTRSKHCGSSPPLRYIDCEQSSSTYDGRLLCKLADARKPCSPSALLLQSMYQLQRAQLLPCHHALHSAQSLAFQSRIRSINSNSFQGLVCHPSRSAVFCFIHGMQGGHVIMTVRQCVYISGPVGSMCAPTQRAATNMLPIDRCWATISGCSISSFKNSLGG